MHCIEAPELRLAKEPARATWTRTRTGIVIGAAWMRRIAAQDATPVSGPHRARNTAGDIAVRVMCTVGLVFVIGLLVLEKMA